MGLKAYEQEIAAAAAHPDREHAVTVLESLARSLRRHEWPAERRAAAYDLSLYAEATARRMIAAGARGPQEEAAAQCRHPAASIKRPAPSLLWCRRCGALATTGGGAVPFERVSSPPPDRSAWLRPSVYTGPCEGDPPEAHDPERSAAQEIANREGYPVHVGCGGEVWSERHGRRRCHRCDLAVPAGEVVEPGDGAR